MSPDSEFWILLGFLIFPVAALVGSAMEGLSEVSMQVWLKKARSSEGLASFFLRSRALKNLEYWREAYLATVQGTSPPGADEKDGENDEGDRKIWRTQSKAAGSFMSGANPQEFEWIGQHYATFVLASNLAFVLSGAIVYVLLTWLAARYDLWWPALGAIPVAGNRVLTLLLGVAGVWALSTHAVGKYLYCHEFAARQQSTKLGERVPASQPSNQSDTRN